ncbi:metallophosphoesterase [Paracoccus yeei]|uniref:metallophosphoesterase n=1 Tax=Paracoccus yeei TaxID=147645 RepID=UPI001CC280F6|nr:metallophosphoesterase [Paracoccus yeei]
MLRDLNALIIAGDLSNDPQRNWPWALSRIARLVAPERIWVIPGNHDYYGTTLDDTVLARIAGSAGVSFAQKRALTFGSCRVLRCTLWTDFALTGDPDAAMARAGWGCWSCLPGCGGLAFSFYMLGRKGTGVSWSIRPNCALAMPSREITRDELLRLTSARGARRRAG